MKIIKGESGIVIWSAAGGILELDEGRNLKRKIIIQLKDKITDVRYHKDGGWFLMMHGKSIALIKNLDDTPLIFRTPGPVMDAYFSENEWNWTGWRHDGKIKISAEGVIEQYSDKQRENIGIHIFDNKVINLEDYKKIELRLESLVMDNLDELVDKELITKFSQINTENKFFLR